MLYIIGVAHRAQARKPTSAQTEAQQSFADRLSTLIDQVYPAFVAEEDSEEALCERQEISISKTICDPRGIENRLCDPTREQRSEIGYRNGQDLEIETFMQDDEGLSNEEIHLKARATELGRYFPIRERFWLERLHGCRESDAIFVCGDAHVETSAELLDSEGIEYVIVERGIGVTPEESADWDRIKQYLATHPHLRIR